ncbi:hypothetical protein GCK32_014542, partial [Trichostrongylus colubriformis]
MRGAFQGGWSNNEGLTFLSCPRNSVKDDIWKDVVSLDAGTREKPIPLKDLFPDDKVIDKTLKRKLANRKKKESAKRRRENREERLKELNEEKEEKEKISYRESSNRFF